MAARRRPHRRETPRRDIRRNCEYCQVTGKICYSKRQARDASADLEHRDGDHDLKIYRCEHCSRYHIGHLSGEFRIKPR